MSAFVLKWQSWVITTEIVWLSKPKYLPSGLSVASPWVRHILPETQPQSSELSSSVGHTLSLSWAPLPSVHLECRRGPSLGADVPSPGPHGPPGPGCSPERKLALPQLPWEDGKEALLCWGLWAFSISQDSCSLPLAFLGSSPLGCANK